MKKLNIGCGNDIKKDHINMDSVKLKGVDCVHDIEQIPFPFKDNTFEEIYCSHILEHVSDVTKVMKEINRISKNNALIKIKVPYFASPNAMGDPTHKRTFNYNTFEYFTNNHYYNNLNFKIIKRKILYWSESEFLGNKKSIINWLININPVVYERFFCYLIPAVEFHIVLQIQK